MKLGDLVKVVAKENMFNGLKGEIIDRKTSRGVLNIPTGAIPVRLNNGVVFYFYPDEIIRVPNPVRKITEGSYSEFKERFKHLINPKDTKQAFKFNLRAIGDRSVGIPSVDEEVIVIFKNGGWNYSETEKWLHETFGEFVDGGHCTKA